MNRKVLTVVWLTIIALVLVFGWPTPYRFEQHNGALVRINRLTGDVESLRGHQFGRPATSAEVSDIMRRYGLDSTTDSTPRTRMQLLWDSAVVLHGETRVLREYGPRPQ